MEDLLGHLVFGEFNPLLLGRKSHEEVNVFVASRHVPPLFERREEVARSMLAALFHKRLIPLGCVQTAVTARHILCVARTPRLDAYFGRKPAAAETSTPAPSQTRVVVQPDFSIIVIGVDMAPAAELVPFCDREKHGGHGALTLRLTRESLVRAVAQGMSPSEIIGRLQGVASNDVPANVLRQVSDWCGWVRRAKVSTGTIIRCPDAETADRVVAVLRKEVERLSESVVLLRRRSLSAAERSKLREQGVLIDAE